MTTVLSKTKVIKRRTKSFQLKKNESITNINVENVIKNNKEDEIESFYNKKEILELKHKILIYRIKKLRNESALKIQNIWNKYIIRNKVHRLSHKVRGCYTVYPEAKDACKMYIKIYINEYNKKEFKILKLDFCPIRKCFVKDIPKNKFYTPKKIMYFNFIKNNRIFFDDKYEKVLYSDEYVHKVDFSIYDKRQKLLDETIYKNIYKNNDNKFELYSNPKHNKSIYKDLNLLSTEDEKENSENSPDKSKYITKFNYSPNYTFNKIEEEDDEYEGLRAIKRKCTNEPIKEIEINKPYKKFKSFEINYPLKSILKEPNCTKLHKRKLNMENKRKVSFGNTVYFY